MAKVTVEGTAWPDPPFEGYQLIEEGNLAPGAARDASNADLLGEFKAYVNQIVLSYAILTGAELRAMYASTAQYLDLSVEFWNYYTGQYETKKFYPDKWSSKQASGEYPDDFFKDVTITLTGMDGYTR